MRLSYLRFLIAVYCTFFPTVSAISQAAETKRLVIVFAGDIMGHEEQIKGAWDAEALRYDYEPTFRYIKDYIRDADIAVGNLEVTLAGPPYRGYPCFSSPDELAEEARNAGFDIMIQANNHALDGGEKGFLRTLDVLESLPILRAGTYRDEEERAKLHPLIIEKNSIRLALLNYTYGTNGITIPAPRQINRIDTAMIRKELARAKEASPDFIIVCIHWGEEYQRTENAGQRWLAEYMFRHGADAIIGSHPHVVQPVSFFGSDAADTLRNPVVYSLGNFVSNQRARYKDGGIIAELHLCKTIVPENAEKGKETESEAETRLEALKYLPYWVWREETAGERQIFYVMPVSRYEAGFDGIELKPDDAHRLERFADDTRTHLMGVPESVYYSCYPDEHLIKIPYRPAFPFSTVSESQDQAQRILRFGIIQSRLFGDPGD